MEYNNTLQEKKWRSITLEKEGILRRLNHVFFIVFLLFIIEGILRKWVVPSLSNVLFFSKDPFVLYSFWLAFRYRLFPQDTISKISYLLFFLLFVYVFIQAFWNDINPAILMLGFRNYALMIPFILLVREYISKSTFSLIAKVVAWLALPSAILVYIQYISPATAFINKNVGMGEGGVFVVGQGVVRVSGFFSFNVGHAYFCLYCFCFFLINFFQNKDEKIIPGWYNPILLFSCIANSALSGSRTNWGYIILFFIFFSLFTILYPKKIKTVKSILYLFVGAIFTYFILITFFERNVELLAARHEGARVNSNENFFLRAVGGYLKIFEPIENGYKLQGEGIGLGSSGAKFLGSLNYGKKIYYESEWPRVIAEAGIIVGALYLLYRIFLGIYIIRHALIIYDKTSSPVPLLLLSSVLWVLVYAQLSFNGASNFFGWYTTGLALASLRIFNSSTSNLSSYE
jgi:hypothetical protein